MAKGKIRMEDLIAEYKQSLMDAEAMLSECFDGAERKVIQDMINELTFAIAYMRCGFDPHNWCTKIQCEV